MVLLLGIVVVAAAVLWAGMAIVSHHYRTPRVSHRRDPGADGIGFEEVRFPTVGGKRLYGWWIPAATGQGAPTLALVHGWGRNVERMLRFIRELHPAGFNLIVFDARSHGSSDADGTANMLKFSADLRAALDEAVRRGADAGGLGVLGLSVGGAAAIHAAAHDPRIGAVVTIGAFAHPGDLMRRELRSRGVPSVLAPLILRYVEHKIGARLNDIAPERQIPRITAPVLLVHGEDDVVVPVDHCRRLATAGGGNVETLILPGRGHSDCNRDHEFWPRVLSVFHRISHSKKHGD